MLNDDEFIYLKSHEGCDSYKNHSSLKIINIKVRFSTYMATELYNIKAPIGSQIQTYAYDFQANKIILMFKVQSHPNHKKLIVYDLTKEKRIGVSWVNDPDIIGRILSGLYTLMDGHMYFDNSVYKIRYDTMINTKSDNIKQEHFIDKYTDILDLKKGEKVQQKMPKLSLNCHKQIYLVANQTYKKPIKLIILPYLHERKLYLNNLKQNNKYFYSIYNHTEDHLDMNTHT